MFMQLRWSSDERKESLCQENRLDNLFIIFYNFYIHDCLPCEFDAEKVKKKK